MFWICDGNNVDDTGMFLLLLSSTHTESSSFPLLISPHQRVGQECTARWEEKQLGQLIQIDQSYIADHRMSFSAYKAGCVGGGVWGCVRMCARAHVRRKEGRFRVKAFVFPKSHYTRCSPAFLEVTELLPADLK